MPQSVGTVVTGKGTLRGVIEAPADPGLRHSHVLVRLDTGLPVRVPADLLVAQADGSYYLPLSLGDLENMQKNSGTGEENPLIIPLVQEELDVQRRKVETGKVQIKINVHEREELIDEPLLREEVKVEQVPVHRLVDSPPAVRQEGEVTIIPLVEEVLVVEKRLMLREEVRVLKTVSEVREPQRVTLRSEQAAVTRTGTKER